MVDQLIDDLVDSDGATVMPAQLQLVCSALYDRLGPDERVITLMSYESQGGARNILQQYLDYGLARFPSDERAMAYAWMLIVTE